MDLSLEREHRGAYEIIVGLNDMCTNRPVSCKKQALQEIICLCNKYFDGYTISDALGGYRYICNGCHCNENSFVITVFDTHKHHVEKFAKKCNTLFCQSSTIILDLGHYTFYTEKEEQECICEQECNMCE